MLMYWRGVCFFFFQAETIATLNYLEEKEDKLSARINQLKQDVLAAGRRVGLEPTELQNLVEVSVHVYIKTSISGQSE